MSDQDSAAKRHRQSEKRRVRNRSIRSRVRNSIRTFLDAIESKNKDAATQQLGEVTKLIDAAAGKGVYHRNTAARTKSRLAKRLHVLESAE